MIGKDTLLENLSKLARARQADGVLVSCHVRNIDVLRVSQDNIRQAAASEDVRIYIKALVGKKVGVAMTSSLNQKDLLKSLDYALSIARLSKPDPLSADFVAQEKELPAVKTYYEETANFSIGERIGLIGKLQGAVKKSGVNMAGSLLAGSEELFVANSGGLIRYQPSTVASVKLIAMQDDASGFASGLSQDAGKLDFCRILDTAIKKCMAGKHPKDIEIKNIDVLLEPEAVSEILDWMGYIGFCAKSFAERRSFLSGRLGEKLMNERVSIYDDGLVPEGLIIPFDFEGVTKKKTMLIENGIARGFVCDTKYGSLYDRRSSGHASTPDDAEGPQPLNLIMGAGESAFDDMLRSMERGILVTRFHYVNGLLDTRRALMTGLTRDGTFLIENGKFISGLKNLRFTQDMLDAFSNIVMVSRERKLTGDPADSAGATLVPALLIKDFTFTGQTP